MPGIDLIQLVSEQTMPNVLCALAARPAKLTLLHTPRTAGHADWIVAACTRAGLNPPCERHELSDTPDLNETGTRVNAAIGSAREAGLTPLLNFTGGTKLMSIGAFAAAHGSRTASVYVDTENQVLIPGPGSLLPAPLDNANAALRAAQDALNVDVITTAHGIASLTTGRDPEPWLPSARLLSKDPHLEAACHAFAEEQLAEGGRTPQDYLKLVDTPLAGLPEQLVEPLALASHITLRDGAWHLAFEHRADLEAFAAMPEFRPGPDYYRTIAPLQQILAFLSGGWWELAVVDELRRSTGFHDVRWSATATRAGGRVPIEEDILAVRGLNLAAFSCKRGGNRDRLQRAFEELDSAARALGGTFAERHLCIARRVHGIEDLRARALATRTHLVGPADRLRGAFGR